MSTDCFILQMSSSSKTGFSDCQGTLRDVTGVSLKSARTNSLDDGWGGHGNPLPEEIILGLEPPACSEHSYLCARRRRGETTCRRRRFPWWRLALSCSVVRFVVITNSQFTFTTPDTFPQARCLDWLWSRTLGKIPEACGMETKGKMSE